MVEWMAEISIYGPMAAALLAASLLARLPNSFAGGVALGVLSGAAVGAGAFAMLARYAAGG